MTSEPRRAVSPLAEVELETLEEGRQWTRQRLEKKLQRLAERQGATSPPLSDRRLKEVKNRPVTVQTVVGKVTIQAAYGKDPETGEWLSPVRVL
jgi:hypothetical protein